MLMHGDRRATLHWVNIGPPLAVALGNRLDGVPSLARATRLCGAPLLTSGFPNAITAYQPEPDRL